MSARQSDPLTVHTQDGSSWWRRAWDAAGHGLYARGDSVEQCPTLRTIRELAEFGLRGMAAPESDSRPSAEWFVEAVAPRVRSLEDPHDSPLHSPRKIPHDLEWPEPGGQR